MTTAARGRPLKETVQSASWSLNLTERRSSGVERRAEIIFTKHASNNGLSHSILKVSAAFIGTFYCALLGYQSKTKTLPAVPRGRQIPAT